MVRQAEDTFRQSGGSICWHRPQPKRADAIRRTAEYILAEVERGAAIRVRRAPYLFFDSGECVPALNVTATDVVDHLMARADVPHVDVGRVRRVTALDGGGCRVDGDAGFLEAQVVVVALGVANRDVFPAPAADARRADAVEKRSLMVTDVPVGVSRADLPHLVLRHEHGYVYAFVKEIDGRLRLLVGQEDLVVDHEPEPVDHLPELMRAGLARRIAFLDGARTDRVLWGFDWVHKDPLITVDGGLVGVTCGSAVRACYAVGAAAAVTAVAALPTP